jgi:hypothetical protein
LRAQLSGGTGGHADRFTGGRFALFADCLLTGVLTAVAAAGVVTALPALAAACAVLRERVDLDRAVGVRPYARRFVQAVRSGPAALLVPPLLLTLLGLDALALAAGAPGAAPLTALLVAASAAAVVLGLRAAAAWRPGLSWLAAARDALAAARRDPGGDALLLLAGVAGAGIVLAVPITVMLVCGPLALAAAAVQGRGRTSEG